MNRQRRLLPLALLLPVLSLVGCGGSDNPPPVTTPTPTPAVVTASTVTVTAATKYQKISGFGGSSAWHATPPSDADADKLFSAQSGAGLSLLRIRIAPDGTTAEMPTVAKATQRGAKVWAAPWSPPGAWKTNGSDINGGKLKPELYQSWADRLADFVRNMADQGVTLTALSAQNEPGWVANWETCEWTASELLTFIRDYLGPSLRSRGLTTPILAPEYNDWIGFGAFADALLNDATAASYLGVIAMHHYGGAPFAYTNAASKGKELWETEMSVKTTGNGMASALDMANSIHAHLTVANVNAWHYWWISDGDSPTQPYALIEGGVVTKRLWVMGNYSKFVRPGSYRIAAEAATGGTLQGLLLTAFRDEAAGNLMVVAANPTSQTVRLPITLADLRMGSVTPWLTSETLDLVAQTSVPGGSTFTYDLPAQSVVTLVGKIQ
jgi:glucuronoarabinoxylan endo-1,4-beta-xylanase